MDMVVGEYKFRLDDGWSTNFGDDGNKFLDLMEPTFQFQ
jgi:hypothetical protein